MSSFSPFDTVKSYIPELKDTFIAEILPIVCKAVIKANSGYFEDSKI